MFPALTARTAYEVFYTRLGQHALSVANYWYDPRHRDLYLKYSLYLAVIDNIKNEDQDTFKCIHFYSTNGINNDTTETVKTRISSSVAAIAAATIKVAEAHDNDNSDTEYETSSAVIDATMADVHVDSYNYFNKANSDSNSVTNADIRKLGITRLQRLVLVGGPDDGVISPWQSR